MTHAETLERMLLEVSKKGPGGCAYANSSLKAINPRHTIECVFNFPPRLRYTRYISSFNRVLNDFTNFEFEVAFIRNHCIQVAYFAREFNDVEKNLVRRQVLKLMRDKHLDEEFNIMAFTLFQKHRYERPSGTTSQNDNLQDR